MLNRRAFVLTTGFAALGAGVRHSSAQSARTLRMTYLYAAESQFGAGATAMANEVAKRTDGRIRIEQFPDAALGGDANMMKGVQLGSIDVAIISASYLPAAVPEVDVFQMPFLFRDVTHARATLDGAPGQDFLKRMSAKNLVALAWAENGLRHISNSKRPILAPEDMKGLKFRLPPSDVLVLAFKTLGAETGVVALPKLYDALQTGQFDGQENPVATMLANNLQKVQKFLTLSGHVYSPAVIVMSPDAYDELSADEKTIFADAARLGAQASRDYSSQADKTGIATIQQAGVQVIADIDRARFAAAMAGAMPEYEKRFGRDLIERIRAVA